MIHDHQFDVQPDDPPEISKAKLELQKKRLDVQDEHIKDVSIFFCAALGFLCAFLLGVPTAALLEEGILRYFCCAVAVVAGGTGGFFLGKRILPK